MTRSPNVLVIVADDLGFSDIGCYGGEISTPHLDALAGDGVRMLNMHTAAACSPTRAMILTGTDAHLGGLGVLIEYKKSPHGELRYAGKPGYEGYLNKDVAPLSEVLQDKGYHTILTGKWHLGMRPDHGPSARGFTKSFSLLPGCCNHYGWEPQLANCKAGMPFGGRPIHVEDGRKADVRPNTTETSDGFYSSDTYTDKLIQYLGERSAAEREKPFFAYHAFSAPHWPNQAPKAVREKYHSTYLDGPDALRQRRLDSMKKLGIIAQDVRAHEVVAPEMGEWESFDEYQKACSARSMAAYAGMVEQMDHNIGRIISYLRQIDEYDNTMIIFLSDNGAEGAAIEAAPVMGAKVLNAIQQFYDNSLENIGNYNSFTWIGPRWAQASTAPSRLYKCWPSEGGILVPCIVKHPLLSKHAGSFNRSFSTCMDIAPTVLDLAGIALPAVDETSLLHRGRAVHRMRGASWLPYFVRGQMAEGDDQGRDVYAFHKSDHVVGWELFARAALRQGRWKIVHLEKSHGGAGVGDLGWELFDIDADPGETEDLAASHPEVLDRMLHLWDEYCRTSQVVWGSAASTPGLSASDAPHLHDDDTEQQLSWMQAKPNTVALSSTS